MARKRVNVTEFVLAHGDVVMKALSREVYDADLLRNKGYSVKNGKVFDHIGRQFAANIADAFKVLDLRVTVLKPARIYVTDDINDIEQSESYCEIAGTYFYTDTMYSEKGE